MATKKTGRPKLVPEQEMALERYTARLSFQQARLARKLGGGNFSEGLRAALERAAEDIEFMEGRKRKWPTK
jgi:hypothetical protein